MHQGINRVNQIVLIGTFIAFSWLVMQAVHEAGHVLGAYMSGGTVAKVVLHPHTISRTDLSHNPHPLFVVWCGPVLGAALPAVILFIARFCRCPGIYMFQFFAGFCLIINGAYIGIGAVQHSMDAGVMLMYGSRLWQLILFGIVASSFGLYLWHGLGPGFGFGKAKGKASRKAAIVSACMLFIVYIMELIIDSK